MSVRARPLLMALAISPAFACGEGIGRALVGELPPPPAADGCSTELECTSIAGAFVPLREGVNGPAIASNCVALAMNVVDSGPFNLHCARWNLTLAPEATRELSLLSTQFTELHVFAERPARLVLIAANLSETQIILHGPVSLRIEQRSQLNNVQLLDDGSGQASFEFVESDARGLVLGEPARDFSGRAVATRSTVLSGRLLARSLRLENTQLDDSAAVADELTMQTVHGRKVRLEVERGTIGNVTLEDFWIQRCGDLQITNSTLQKILLVPCKSELHIDRSDLLEGSIAGRIASKETGFRGLSVGAGLATELELWGGLFYDNILCDELQHFALSSRSQCNLCPTLGAAVAAISCRIAKPPAELGADAGMDERLNRNPECPALDEPPFCEPNPSDVYPF